MKILLVRLRLIGDVVFTTPLIRALRQHDPSAHLTYLVEPAAAAVVEHNPHLNRVVVAPKARGLARIRHDYALAMRLRHERFDVAIDFHGGPRSAWLTWASGAPTRIGYTIRGRAWMYTHRVTRTHDFVPRHSVLNQWDLLAPLGIPPGTASQFPLDMHPDPAAAERVTRRLALAGLGSQHPLIIVHVSAGNLFRRWPAAAFEALLVALAERDANRRIIVTAGPSDAGAARQITDAARARLGSRAVALPDIGEVDLGELRALVERAAVYIGGDSGPLHIAATTSTPIVELLGPTLAERSRPWRDDRWYSETVDAGPLPCRPCHQRRCAPGDFRCLVGLSPDRVIAAAERALAHQSAAEGRAHAAIATAKEAHA